MEVQSSPCLEQSVSLDGYAMPHWYVAYTYPRHEKAVADQLQLRMVETFLPTYNRTSQWKDRKVKLDLPLFPGYVFVRLPQRERVKVVSISGVIRMLSNRGALVPINDEEIEAIRTCIRSGVKLHPHPYITVGDWVRVREGVFEGLKGIVVRQSNKCKLVVSIALIHQSVSLEIDPECLEVVKPPSSKAGDQFSLRQQTNPTFAC